MKYTHEQLKDYHAIAMCLLVDPVVTEENQVAIIVHSVQITIMKGEAEETGFAFEKHESLTRREWLIRNYLNTLPINGEEFNQELENLRQCRQYVREAAEREGIEYPKVTFRSNGTMA